MVQGRGCKYFSGAAVPIWKGNGEEKKSRREKRLAEHRSILVELDILLNGRAKGEGVWTLGVEVLVAHGVG